MHARARRVFGLMLALGPVALGSIAGEAHAARSSEVKGAPSFKPGEVLGAYFWQDDAGLHARFSTDGKAPHVFAGKLCARGIMRLDAVDLEEGDKLEVGGAGKCVHFEFAIDAGVDGYDFAIDGPLLRFELDLDGKPLDAKLTWLGKDGRHPHQKRFAVQIGK